MANTTSRILIELVAKADTTEFNKVIHGLTQVETKANDLATAIAKSGNTGGYGDTVRQLQKVVSGFSNAAETAGLLRRELQSLQEAKISGILTNEDARTAERHIGRLAEKLREFVALTERRIDGGLQRQLQDLAEVPIDGIPAILQDIRTTLGSVQPPTEVDTAFRKILTTAQDLITYLDRTATGVERIDSSRLYDLVEGLIQATAETEDTVGGFDKLKQSLVELSNQKTDANFWDRLFGTLEGDRISGLAGGIDKVQEMALHLGQLLRDDESQLKYVRNNTAEIRDAAHETGTAFRGTAQTLQDLYDIAVKFAATIGDGINPAGTRALEAAYADLITLLRRNRDAFTLDSPNEAAFQTIAAFRDLNRIISDIGEKRAANILGLKEEEIGSIRATAAYLEDARQSAGLMTAELRTVAQELSLVEQKRLDTTTTTRSLLSRTELTQDEERQAQARLAILNRLYAASEALETSGQPIALNDELGKVEVRAERATKSLRDTAETAQTTAQRVAGIGQAYGNTNDDLALISAAFDDSIDDVGALIDETHAFGRAAGQAATEQVDASARAAGAIQDQTRALRDLHEEQRRPALPAAGPDIPYDADDELPHLSLAKLIGFQKQLLKDIYATNQAAEAQQAAFAGIAERIAAQESKYKSATDGSLENIQKARDAWTDVTAAAERYGQAVAETTLATRLLSRPFADLSGEIEKARAAAVDYGDITKLTNLSHKHSIDLVGELVALEKQRGRITGKLTGDEEQLSNLAKQARILQDAIDAGKDSSGALNEALEGVQMTMAKIAAKTDDVRKEVLGLVVSLANQGENLGSKLFNPAALQGYSDLLAWIKKQHDDLRAGANGAPGTTALPTTSSPETTESMARLAQHIKDAGEAADKTAADLRAYGATLQDTRGAVDQFMTTNEGAQTALNGVGRAIQRQQDYMKDAQRTWDLLAAAVQAYDVVMDKVAANPELVTPEDYQSIAEMRTKIEMLILSIGELANQSDKLEGINIAEAIRRGNELQKAETETRNLNKAIEQTKTRMEALKHVGKNISQMLFGSDLKTMLLTGTLLSFGREIENIFQGMAQNIKEWLDTASQQFDQFREKSIQLFAAMPGVSAMARDAVIGDILKIGAEYGYLTDETIPAAYRALQLGVPEGNLYETMSAAAETARVTGGDFLGTLESGQNIINAYGGKITDLNKIYDLLFYAQQNAGVSADGLTQALAPVIAVTGDLGVSLEDIISAMITMSRQGDDLETISSLLSNMFTQIQISGTALGGVFEEAAGTDFRTFIANGGTLIEAMQLIQKQAEVTGTSIPALVGGDSSFYRDQQAMLAVLELNNQHLAELINISTGVRAAQDLIADGYSDIADEAFLSNRQTAAQIEQMNLKAAKSWEPVRLAWSQFKAEAAAGVGEMFSISQANKEWDEFAHTLSTLPRDNPMHRYAAELQMIQEALAVGANENHWWDGDHLKSSSVAWAYLNGNLTSGEQRVRQLAIAEKLLSENAAVGNRELVNASYAIYDIVTAAEANEKPTVDMMNNLRELTALFPETYKEVRAFLVELGLAPPLIDKTAGAVLFLNNEIEKLGVPAPQADPSRPTPLAPYKYMLEEIAEILDGDTFKAIVAGSTNPITIRLPHVDAPEIRHLDENGKPVGSNESYGQAARRFTEEWFIEVTDLEVSAESAVDTYERSLRTVKGKLQGAQRQLQEDLLAAGLVIPLPVEITHNQAKFDEQMEIAIRAAEQGAGMFQNRLAQAMFLEGSIDSTKEIVEVIELQRNYFPEGLEYARQMTAAQEALNDATGEYVDTYRDNSARIRELEQQLQSDLTDTQKKELDKRLEQLDINSAEAIAIRQQLAADLTDNERAKIDIEIGELRATDGRRTTSYTGDVEAAEEAAKQIEEIQADMQRNLANHAYTRLFDFEGMTAEMGELAVAMGIMSESEADMAVTFAQRKAALDMLPQAFAAVTLSAEREAQAVKLIIEGSVTTAAEAIRRVQNLQEEQDWFDLKPGEFFSTDVYWQKAGMERPEDQVINSITFAPTLDDVALEQFNQEIEELRNENKKYYLTPADNLEYTRYHYRAGLQTFLTANPVDASVGADTLPAQQDADAFKVWLGTQTYTVKVHAEFDTDPPDRDGDRAGGGHVSAQGAYWVGELGPELFVPYNSGRIIPTHQLHDATPASNITVQIDARGNRNANQIGRASRNGVLAAAKRMGIRTR